MAALTGVAATARAGGVLPGVLVIATQGSTASAVSSFTPTLPTGYAVGDLLLITCGVWAVTAAVTVSAGWTVVNTSHTSAVCYKFAASTSEAAPTLTTIANTYWGAQVTAFRNVDTTTPIDAFESRDVDSYSGFVADLFTLPACLPRTASTYLVAFTGCSDAYNARPTAYSGMTAIGTTANNGSYVTQFGMQLSSAQRTTSIVPTVSANEAYYAQLTPFATTAVIALRAAGAKVSYSPTAVARVKATWGVFSSSGALTNNTSYYPAYPQPYADIATGDLLLFALVGAGATISAPSAYTVVQVNSSLAVAYRAVPASYNAGADTLTLTTTGACYAETYVINTYGADGSTAVFDTYATTSALSVAANGAVQFPAVSAFKYTNELVLAFATSTSGDNPSFSGVGGYPTPIGLGGGGNPAQPSGVNGGSYLASAPTLRSAYVEQSTIPTSTYAPAVTVTQAATTVTASVLAIGAVPVISAQVSGNMARAVSTGKVTGNNPLLSQVSAAARAGSFYLQMLSGAKSPSYAHTLSPSLTYALSGIKGAVSVGGVAKVIGKAVYGNALAAAARNVGFVSAVSPLGAIAKAKRGYVSEVGFPQVAGMEAVISAGRLTPNISTQPYRAMANTSIGSVAAMESIAVAVSGVRSSAAAHGISSTGDGFVSQVEARSKPGNVSVQVSAFLSHAEAETRAASFAVGQLLAQAKATAAAHAMTPTMSVTLLGVKTASAPGGLWHAQQMGDYTDVVWRLNHSDPTTYVNSCDAETVQESTQVTIAASDLYVF